MWGNCGKRKNYGKRKNTENEKNAENEKTMYNTFDRDKKTKIVENCGAHGNCGKR